MTFEIALLLGIITLGMVLFSMERLPADVIALGILLLLVLTGLLPAQTVFAGFGSETVFVILGLLILTAALAQTGVVDLIGRVLLRRVGRNPSSLLVAIMGASAALSAFISNTGATAFFLPITISLARQLKVSASKLLMPLAFSTILASSVTLIGTSTNLVVSGFISDYGLKPLGMFELTLVGLPVLVAGMAYMLTLGRRWIPSRVYEEAYVEDFGIQPYLTEVLVLPDSPLAGATLEQSGLGRDLDLTVVRILRGERQLLLPHADTHLMENDLLLVEGSRDTILRVQERMGIQLKPRIDVADSELESDQVGLFEVILLPRSPLIGRTLRKLQFRERFGIQVLGVQHFGKSLHRKLAQTRFAVGDQLLLQGHPDNVQALSEENLFRLLRPVDMEIPDLGRSPYAIGIFAVVLVLAALNLMPLSIALLLGVVAAFLTRTVTPEEAYRQVEWKALILIGSMFAIGQAMEVSGAAEFIAIQIVRLTHAMHTTWLLSGFFFLTMLLTQPMSNQAASIVVLPIAMQTSAQLGLNPRSFAIMIAVAASCSFLTHLEPACLMVYGPGRYRFADFLKVGAPLTVLIFLIAILLVPSLWPLR
jgi:di/tricarboxylate transporter